MLLAYIFFLLFSAKLPHPPLFTWHCALGSRGFLATGSCPKYLPSPRPTPVNPEAGGRLHSASSPSGFSGLGIVTLSFL